LVAPFQPERPQLPNSARPEIYFGVAWSGHLPRPLGDFDFDPEKERREAILAAVFTELNPS
jgi:hypothetical protein